MVKMKLTKLMRDNKRDRPERPLYTGSIDELMRYLESEAVHHNSMYHYTQWDNFRKMLTPVVGGACSGKRVMLLSCADTMNDRIEKKWGDRVFYTCFSYSKYEDVAMWMNYGKRSPDAIRVRFDGNDVRRWFEEHSRDKSGIYRVKGDPSSGDNYTELKPEEIDSVQFADVAYVIHSKLLSKPGEGKHNGNVEYGRDFFRIECPQAGDGLGGSSNGLAWSDAVFEGDPRRVIEDLPPFFKKRGWGYERETRLVITLKPGVERPDRIAIDFGAVFDGARVERADDSRKLVRGPWFKHGISSPDLCSTLSLDSDYCEEIKIVANSHRKISDMRRELDNYVKWYDECDSTDAGEQYTLSADDVDFLSAVRSELRCVQKSVETRCKKAQAPRKKVQAPNEYKLRCLSLIDLRRLARLSCYDDLAYEYVCVFRQLDESAESGWAGKVSKPSSYDRKSRTTLRRKLRGRLL